MNDDDFRIRYITNSRGDKAVSSKRIVRCVQFSWNKMKKNIVIKGILSFIIDSN